MTEVDVINYILNQNIELKETYELYQSILYALQRNDYGLFENIIEKDYETISDYMRVSLNTLKEFKEHIKNTLEQPYSNGVMERNNNTCKLIKRVAFGFRNFKNFKVRILISTNILRNVKEWWNFFITPQSLGTDFDVLDYIEFNDFTKEGVQYIGVLAKVRIVYYDMGKVKSKFTKEEYLFKKNPNERLELKDGANMIKCYNCGASIDATKGACSYCHTEIKYLQEWILGNK